VAARHAYDSTVRQLCRCGADVNVQDEHGETALHIAAWHGFSSVLHVLGEVGARLDTRNHDFETAIHCAAARGHFRCVRQLLRLGANPNIQDKNGCSPLHLALRRRHARIALLLLRHRAVRLDLLDLHGDSVLHIACRQRLSSIVHVLTAKLAECSHLPATDQSLIDCRNRIGDTPLHVSVNSGQVELVRTLLAAGADLQCCDSNQNTALTVAQKASDSAHKAKQSERECTQANDILTLLQITSSHRQRCALLSQLRPFGSIRTQHVSSAPHRCVDCSASLLNTKAGCCNQLPGVCVATDRNSCCNRSPNWWSYWLPALLRSVALSSPLASNELLAGSSAASLPAQLQKCRLVLLGHSGVGKSSLLDTLCCGYFSSFWRKPRPKSSHSTVNSPMSTNVSAAPSCVSLASSGAAESSRGDATSFVDDLSINHHSMMDAMWSSTALCSCCTVNGSNHTTNLDRESLLTCSRSCIQVRPMHVPTVGDLVVWSFGAACTDFTLADRLLEYDSLHLLLLRANDTSETQLSQAHFWLRLLVNVLPVQTPLNRLGQTARPVRVQIVYTHLDQLATHQQQCSNNGSSNKSTIASQLTLQCNQLRQQYEHLLSIAATPIMLDATASSSSGVKLLKQLLLEEKESRFRLLGPTCSLLETCAKHIQHLRSPPTGSALTTRPQLIQSFQQTLNPLASDWQLRAICRQLRLLAELHPLRNPRIDGVNLLLLDPVWFANRVLESLFKQPLSNETQDHSVDTNRFCANHSSSGNMRQYHESNETKGFAHRRNSASPSSSADSTANLGTSLRLSLDQLQSLQPQTDALDLLLLLQNLELCSSSEGDFEYLFPAQFSAGSLAHAHSLYASSRGCLSSSCCLSTSGYLSNSAASVISAASPSHTIPNEDVQLAILLRPSSAITGNGSSPSLGLLFGRLQVLLERASQTAALLPNHEQVQLIHHPGQVRIYLFGACISLRICRDVTHPDPSLYVHLTADEESTAARAFRTFELLASCVQALVNNIWPGQYLTRSYVSVTQLRRGDQRPYAYSAEQINRTLLDSALQSDSLDHLLQQTVVAPDGTEDRLDLLLLAGTRITADFLQPDQLVGFESRLEEQLVRLQKLNLRSQLKQCGLNEPDEEEAEPSEDEDSESRSDDCDSDGNELPFEDDRFSDDESEAYGHDRHAEPTKRSSLNGRTAAQVQQWLSDLCGDVRSDSRSVQFGLLRPVLGVQTHVCDLPLAVLQALCALFDRPHEFGLDWCLLGVQLQMTDKLPFLDGSTRTTSSTWRLLQECRNRVDFSVSLLCNILQQIGRNDAYQLLLEATPPMQLLPLHSNTFKLIVHSMLDQND
jgi:ankyrin repeat protein